MNNRMVIRSLGRILRASAALLLLPALTSLIYRENGSLIAFLITAAVCFVLGQAMAMVKTPSTKIFAREGIVIVALVWIILSLLGALPYVIAGVCGYIDALFTIVSGLTTTGAAVLIDPEALPRGILFWSCFSHWIGGMGVLVFVMAVIPLAGKNSMHLMRAEVPGPQVGKLVPKARKTALILYGIYLCLTILEMVLLWAGGLSFYDALLHAFSTAGTGGFSTMNSSIAAFDSLYVECVIAAFMFLFALNFNLFYFLLLRRFRDVFRSEELRVFVGLVVCAIVLMAINLSSYYDGFFNALRYTTFVTMSTTSTTGFSLVDYNFWPTFSKVIIICLTIVGGCAGSTAGGIKLSRAIIAFKLMGRVIRKTLQPRSVSAVRFEGRRMDDEAVSGVSVYLVVYTLLFLGSVVLISFNGFDVLTTFSSVLTCMSNVGPGFELVGPMGSFVGFSAFSKLVFCLDMLLGRLEVFPLIALCSLKLWKSRG